MCRVNEVMDVTKTGTSCARAGEWYVRWDNGELFQVTSHDAKTHANTIENFDGEIYEICDESWQALPLTPVQPPTAWTAAREASNVAGTETSETINEGPAWNRTQGR